MSKFTGKFDFCDFCEMGLKTTKQELIEKSDFFLGNAKLKINEPRDLIPYYTNLVVVSSPRYVSLSTKSYIDTQEREEIEISLNNLIREYKIAKRKKAKIDLTHLGFYPDFEEQIPQCLEILDTNKEIVRTYLPFNTANMDFIIDTYFKNLSLKSFNKKRMDFLKYAAKFGYMSSLDDIKGERHPLLLKMSYHLLQ